MSFLVRMIPGTNPPIPLAWKISSVDDYQALGIKRSDRVFATLDDFYKTGVLRHGSTTELLNTTEDPWDQIQSNYETEVRVKPWLADPEILGLWYASALEGRSITEAELQGTDWWRTHTEAQRSWLALNASDPATAQSMIDDNRARVSDMFGAAGIENATEGLISIVADKWTTGDWSQIYATNQVMLLADPNKDGTLDPSLNIWREGLDTTRAGEDDVKDLIQTWLGPSSAQNWSQKSIDRWASRFRDDPDARIELEDALKRHRLALFPEYDNANLTYEDIAAPWRGVWSQEWGGTPDETDPLFSRIIRLNDVTAAQKVLRQEGLKRGNGSVSKSLLSDLSSAFGDQVRRADPAVL
jgi:hypothetical protein